MRHATREDVPVLVALINRAYRVEEFFVRGQRTSEEETLERMERPGACFLVAEEGDAIAGTVFVQVKGTRGFFAMLSVDPDRQKTGLGRRLVTAVEEHCRAAGCHFLDLDVVNLREELPAFYRKLGFAPYDTAPFHEPSKLTRPAHLVLMTKMLGIALVVAVAMTVGCRNAPSPQPAAAPAVAATTPGATWDPWEDAKSRGIDFRAVGNEPGWFLEIDNEKWMRLLYAYGERQATVPVAARETSGGTTRIASSGGGHALKVEITAGPCSDGMSDQSYPLSVTVEIDGTALRGCGRALTAAAPGGTEAPQPAGKTSRR